MAWALTPTWAVFLQVVSRPSFWGTGDVRPQPPGALCQLVPRTKISERTAFPLLSSTRYWSLLVVSLRRKGFKAWDFLASSQGVRGPRGGSLERRAVFQAPGSPFAPPHNSLLPPTTRCSATACQRRLLSGLLCRVR